jgi:hypothetical protein
MVLGGEFSELSDSRSAKKKKIRDRDRHERLKILNASTTAVGEFIFPKRSRKIETLPVGMVVIVTETIHTLQQQFLVAD